MRRIACWGMLIAALAAHRIGCADPPEPAPVDDQPAEAPPKQWLGFECPLRKVRRPGQILTDEELKIEKSLSRDVSMHFDNAPFSDVVRRIGAQAEINICLDIAGLEDEAVPANTKVSINVDNIRAKTALALLLEPLRLAYTIKDDVLKITSRAKAVGELITVDYSVADLVLPIGIVGSDNAPQDRAKKANFQPLMNLISTTVQPDSWEDLKGPGSMMPYRTNLSLVIRQTPAVHDEIADLLGQLRRTADYSVVVEMTLVQIPEEEIADTLKTLDKADSVLAGLNAKRILEKQRLAKKPGTNSRIKSTAMSKLSVQDGRMADFISDTQTDGTPGAASYGVRVHSAISLDRKNIRMKIAAAVDDVSHVLGSNIALSARDQETVVCDVTRLLAVYRRLQSSSPGPLDAPAIREVIEQVRPKQPGIREFLIITPRVLIPDEEEELLGVDLPQR